MDDRKLLTPPGRSPWRVTLAVWHALILRAVVGELVRSKWWYHLLFKRNYRIEMVTAYLFLQFRVAFSVL